MVITDTTTMISLSIKRKLCDKWEEMALEELCKSVAHTEQLLQSLDGTESVAQLKKGRTMVYLCGTNKLTKQMAARGNTFTFPQGLAYMREHRLIPKLVEAVNQPILLEAVKVFGAHVSEVEVAP